MWLISLAQKVFGAFLPLHCTESLMPVEEEVMEFSTPILKVFYGSVLWARMIDLSHVLADRCTPPSPILVNV